MVDGDGGGGSGSASDGGVREEVLNHAGIGDGMNCGARD